MTRDYLKPESPNKTKVVQEFSPDYLAQCQKMSTEEILAFLDQFRRIHGNPASKKQTD